MVKPFHEPGESDPVRGKCMLFVDPDNVGTFSYNGAKSIMDDIFCSPDPTPIVTPISGSSVQYRLRKAAG